MGEFRSKRMTAIAPLLKSLFSYFLNRPPETARKRSAEVGEGARHGRISSEKAVRNLPSVQKPVMLFFGQVKTGVRIRLVSGRHFRVVSLPVRLGPLLRFNDPAHVRGGR